MARTPDLVKLTCGHQRFVFMAQSKKKKQIPAVCNDCGATAQIEEVL